MTDRDDEQITAKDLLFRLDSKVDNLDKKVDSLASLATEIAVTAKELAHLTAKVTRVVADLGALWPVVIVMGGLGIMAFVMAIGGDVLQAAASGLIAGGVGMFWKYIASRLTRP